ncbi:MAG: CRISPR-associated protein Cas4 [Verrucomicrobia bacterium]|nr:CRISPR-associated protein Cas4 [Verrucomicrobiota bacterium]MCH8528953.1 CRISPR-associated protein Cas4 [Kiritimatiellia bacterium]
MATPAKTPPYTDEQLLLLSGIQHWIYCPRQYALIHLEQMWTENRYTAEGRVVHDRAHEAGTETRRNLRIIRGLTVKSYQLGLTGVCDVVEFERQPDGSERILPIEYKRGKPKEHLADSVQLCAQAMCLEEMNDCAIPTGAIFYHKIRKRQEVHLDEPLREITRKAAAAMQEIMGGGITPVMDYQSKRCDACSLIDLCNPKRLNKSASAYLARAQKELTE